MSFEGISFKRFLRGTNHEPIPVEEERRLIKRCMRGDRKARIRLIEGNQRFIIRVAMNMRDQGMPLADLIQEGNLGLIEALRRFDPERGCRLISYGAWWIRLYMQRCIEQKSRTVNIPINKISMLKKIRNVEFTFRKMHGRDPHDDEIASELDLPVKKIVEAQLSASSCHSFQAPDENGQSMEEKMPIDDTDLLTHSIWVSELSGSLKRAMEILTERERVVLAHRFGLNGIPEPLSLRQVGKRIGLSAEGVRQIQEQALTKLRGEDAAPLLEDFCAA